MAVLPSRDLWADNGKAICIWLMVLGHTSLPSVAIYRVIYAFHMPFFFFISGYYDNSLRFDKLGGKNGLIGYNVRRLLIPYFFFSILSLSYGWIYPFLHPDLYPGQQTVLSYLSSAIIGTFLMYDNISFFSCMPNATLWFLPALFFMKIFFGSIQLLVRKELFRYSSNGLLEILFFFIIVLVLFYKIKQFSLYSSTVCIPIYALGFFLKRRILSFSCWQLLLFGFVPFYIESCVANGEVGYNGGTFGNSLCLFYINAIWGIALISILSLFLERLKISLSKVGSSTITILGINLFFCIIAKIIITLLHVEYSILVSVFIATISCIIGSYLHSLLLMHLPFVFGK